MFTSTPSYQKSATGWRALSGMVTSGDGAHPLVAPAGWEPVSFGRAATDLVTVGLPAGPVTLGLPGATIGTPVLRGGSVVYRDVARATDLTYTPSTSGVKEQLVLGSASAPRSFTFHLADPRGLLGVPSRAADDSWTFSKAAASGDRVVLAAPAAWSIARPATRDGRVRKTAAARAGMSAHQSVARSGDGWDVTLSVDPNWLRGQVFPIVLDPSISYSSDNGSLPMLGAEAVSQGRLFNEGGSPYLGYDYRAYTHVDLSSLAGATVSSATLSFGEGDQSNGPGAAAFPVDAHAATQILSSGDSGSLLVSAEAAAVVGNVPASGPYSMDLTAQVKKWVTGSDPGSAGLILQVPGGISDDVFLSSVSLVITYTGGSGGTLGWTVGTPPDGAALDSESLFPIPTSFGAGLAGIPAGSGSNITLTSKWAPATAGSCDNTAAVNSPSPTLSCQPTYGATGDLMVTATTVDGLQRIQETVHFSPGGGGPGGGGGGGGGGGSDGDVLGWDDATPAAGTSFEPAFGTSFELQLDASTVQGEKVTITYGQMPVGVICALPASSTGREAVMVCTVIGDGVSAGTLTFTATTADGALSVTRSFHLIAAPDPVTAAGPGSGAANPQPCSTSQPVNCASGDFWHTFTDVTVPGRGVSLDLQRTYDAAGSGTTGPLGFGWRSSYGWSLATTSSGVVAITQGNGAVLRFAPTGEGAYTQPGWEFATLTGNTDGSYTMTDSRALIRYQFNASGQLVTEIDRNGYVTTLSYAGGLLTSVADPAGRTLALSYDGNGHLVKVLDPAGRTVSYRYDSVGQLTSSTDVAGGVWTYTYDTSHRLLAMTDPRGGATTNTYDSAGRVVRQVDPMGRATTFSYTGDPSTDAGGTTTITDGRGVATQRTFARYALVRAVRAAGTAAQAAWTYAYDPATMNVSSAVDPDGHTTSYTYDPAGNTLSITDPLGRVTDAAYNSLNEPTRLTDPAGVATTLTYDSAGNLTGESAPLTSTNQNSVTRLLYGDAAHPGDLTSVVDPDGRTWVLRYDVDGETTAQVDPLGDTSTTAFDSIGRPTSSVAPNGNLAGANPAAFTTTTAYNARGQVIKSVDPLGHISVMTYDGDGNLLTNTDGLGHVTGTAYDADNEPTTVTKADGTISTFGYDADGNQTSQVDGNGHTTSYGYTPLNQLATITDPLGHSTTYGYDLTGNRTTSTDPRGITSTSTYDAANQPAAISYSDSTPAVAYGYTVDGQRASMTDETGTTSYAYDSLNRLTGQTNGAGQAVGYGYDLAGRLTALTYPNGQTVTRTYDVNGQLSGVTDWAGHTTAIAHDADGNTTNDTYGNGVQATSVFNNADQLTGITDTTNTGTALATFGYTRDNDGQLTSTTSTGAAAAPAESYAYTALNQLRSVNTAAYAYDPAENLTSKSGSTLTYDAASQLSAMTGPGGATSYGYDQAGDRTSSAGGTDTSSAACGICVLAPSVANSVTVSGTAAVSSTGVVGVASISTSAITGSGSATLHGSTVYTAGAVKLTGTAAVTPSPVAALTTDPLASVTAPSGTATRGALTVTGAAHASAQPGVYASINVAGAGTLTLAPGDYVLAGGNLTAAGSASITGSHVTIYLTCTSYPSPCPSKSAGAALNLSGNAGLTLNGSADPAGITVFGDRNNTAATSISGSATATITGDVYTPAAGLSVSGDTLLTANGTLVTGQISAAGSSKVTETAPKHLLPSTTYSYDAEHRLTVATSGPVTSSYTYDGGGLSATAVTGGSTQHYAWDMGGGLPLMLTDGTTSYLYDDSGTALEQVAADGSTAYYQHDQYSSTRALTNQAGTVVAGYVYDAYGALTSRTGLADTPLRWNGQQQQATGLYYLRNRYYDPATGMFLTRDPLGPVTLSTYSYGAGNPLNLADPSGAWVELECVAKSWDLFVLHGVKVACQATDSEGNHATVVTKVRGLGIGLGMSSVSFLALSEAPTVFDLAGWALENAAGAALGVFTALATSDTPVGGGYPVAGAGGGTGIGFDVSLSLFAPAHTTVTFEGCTTPFVPHPFTG